MKRTVLVSFALVFTAASARAQGLTMGTTNGWTFTFSGNVNAFLTYTSTSCKDPGGLSNGCGGILGNLVPTGDAENVTRIRTGLAPGFAIFDAKGKEGNLDLGVHFGFAPEIQNADRMHDQGGFVQVGAQIDMREAYLTAGGTWGQILAGRTVGLYQKENLLTDMTVYGFGLSGGGASGQGTSLGHIGTGYLYPNFNAQMTYSTPSNRAGVFSVGLFDPSIVTLDAGQVAPPSCGPPCILPVYDVTSMPRLEAEYVYTKQTGTTGSADKVMFYVSGLIQQAKSTNNSCCVGATSITPWGLAGGIEWNAAGWQIDASGSYNDGLGTFLMFDDGTAVDFDGKRRTSYSYLAQLQYTLKNSDWKVGASYGLNHLSQTTFDKANLGSIPDMAEDNSALVASATYMWTKSLRWVFEYTYGSSSSIYGVKSTSNQGAVGMMLFF